MSSAPVIPTQRPVRIDAAGVALNADLTLPSDARGLIVGSLDEVVIELNRLALERLPGERELHIVPGATHLFEEPGGLDEVARLAGNWFARHLV